MSRRRDLEALIGSSLSDPEPLITNLLERSIEQGSGSSTEPVLTLEEVLEAGSPVEDLFMLALITRAFTNLARVVEPDWLQEIGEDYWRLRGVDRRTIRRGADLLIRMVRQNRTRLDDSPHPIGFPLGHVWFEQSHLIDMFQGSSFLAVRSLTGEYHVVEHLETAMERPMRLEILGVIRAADAEYDFRDLLENTKAGRLWPQRHLCSHEVKDPVLPETIFDFLLDKRRG
jgi:hypothetical protein